MARLIEGRPITTARPEHTAHPRIEGTKVASRPPRRERFKEIPITEGEAILVEPSVADGFILPSPEVLESLRDEAVQLRYTTEKEEAAKKAAAEAKKAREEVRDGILPVIKENPGLRGLTSTSHDVKLTATPTHSDVVFDIDKLKQSLRWKKRFRRVTSRVVTVEFTPRKDMSPEVVKTIIENGLNSLGARVARKASMTSTWVVDDGVVADMVRSKEVKLIDGTRQVKEGLSLKAERLPVRQKNIKSRKSS